MRERLFRFFWIVLAGVFSVCVQNASAAELPQTVTLHIDDGFLGHAVSLEAFDGQVKLSWEAGDVIAPGDVTLSLSTSSEVTMVWSSSYILGPRGVLLGLRGPDASSTDPWTDQLIQTKAPFGGWKTSQPIAASDVLAARVGPEARLKLTSAPHGMRVGFASWYRYKKCRCAASPDFPKGTRLLVRRADDPSKYTVVRVNDYGPDRSLFKDRAIDLDSKIFTNVGKLSEGEVRVTVEPLLPSDPRWKLADLSWKKSLPVQLAAAP